MDTTTISSHNSESFRKEGNRYRYFDIIVPPTSDNTDPYTPTLNEALRLLRLSARAENVEAMVDLGDMLSMELAPEEEHFSEAFKWYEKAAQYNNLAAYIRLGMMYEQGLVDGHIDMEHAAEYYALAVKEQSPIACYNMARMYQFGRGVERDMSRAISLYEKAIELGDTLSIYYLAELFSHSQPARAEKLYSDAIAAGVYEAEYSLAMLLISQNRSSEAIPLLESTSRRGGALAQKAMQQLPLIKQSLGRIED